MNTAVSTYVTARSNLHREVQSQRLIAEKAATVQDDQVTLGQDVKAGSVTYKAGSTYNLDPYSDREKCSESLKLVENGAATTIKHEYDPGFFFTEETLDVNASAGSGFTSSSQSNGSAGWRPDGWVQKQVENTDGFILKA